MFSFSIETFLNKENYVDKMNNKNVYVNANWASQFTHGYARQNI